MEPGSHDNREYALGIDVHLPITERAAARKTESAARALLAR